MHFRIGMGVLAFLFCPALCVASGGVLLRRPAPLIVWVALGSAIFGFVSLVKFHPEISHEDISGTRGGAAACCRHRACHSHVHLRPRVSECGDQDRRGVRRLCRDRLVLLGRFDAVVVSRAVCAGGCSPACTCYRTSADFNRDAGQQTARRTSAMAARYGGRGPFDAGIAAAGRLDAGDKGGVGRKACGDALLLPRPAMPLRLRRPVRVLTSAHGVWRGE